MSRDILVSIIVPMYNVEKYIENCLLSIRFQSIENIEIIVVDDKSTDGSFEIVERLAHDDDRIKLISLKENSGPGVARNTGIKYASGKYCMFMDADDMYVDNESVEFIYNIAEKNGFKVACCDKIDFDNEINAYIPGSSIRCGECICNSTDILSVFWYTTYIYNREFLIKNGIYFPKIRIFEDPIFLAKVLKETGTIFCSNRPIYVYRVMHKKTEYTLDKVKTILSAQEEIRNILNTYISKYYNESDDKDTWFSKIKALCDFLGYASDMKEYRNNPDSYKGSVADVSMVIRVALTTKTMPPDLYEIMKILGKDKIEHRISLIAK